MALTQVTGPYPIFTDLDGTPLDDGYLYIGAINQDPEQNPIQVFWNANLTIPATQPIRTSNGYAYRNGTPALLYTAGEFSITIRNKREEFVLYSPVGYGFDPAAVSASVVKNDFVGDGVEVDFTLSASPSTILATNVFINGVYQEKDSYTLSGNVITFSIAPPLNSSIEVMTNETGVINTGNATAITYTASFAGATAQTVQTKLAQYVSVKDFGAVGNGVANDTAALQAAFSSGAKSVYIPAGTYKITLSGLTLGSNIEVFGDGPQSVLLGPDPLTVAADVTGNGILIDGRTNVSLRNFQVKNGYKGVGVKVIGSSNIKLTDMTVDGFTDGIWIGESATLKGCQNVLITRPIISNSRYWGVYVRALGVTVAADFTRYVTLDGGYFYNCNMAGFVVAEGTPEHIMLSNTNFQRCPVAMHFELCNNYTVVNCKDYDTNKYPDQVPCNTEYPFPTLSPAPQAGWSQYHFGSSKGTTVGCTFEQTVNSYASSTARTTNIKYSATEALVWTYQGAGAVVDTNKNFFESHSWDNCLSKGVFIFQIEPDTTLAFLRNFKVVNSECQIGINGNSAGGTNVAVTAARVYEFSFQNNVVRNGYLRVKGLGNVNISNNNFFGGTDRNQTILDGTNGALSTFSFLNFSGNQVVNAGGVVIGDSAFLIQNWSVARSDSVIYGSGNTNYIIRFKDSYRIEVGPAFLANAIVANYVDTGVTTLVTW